MSKPVAAQMFAAIPPRDDDQMIEQAFALQHSDNDHTGPCLPVVALEWATVGQQDSPCVMGCLGIGFITLEVL